MSTLKDLARIMAERNDMQRTESEQFVITMFDVLKEALAEEGQVKIKGLGTFKVQTMKERASVNINTGEKVIIDSHERVTFTPDTSMRDSVNKPFAHFDTVVLNEGVFFDDIDAENDKTSPEPVVQEAEKTFVEKKETTPLPVEPSSAAVDVEEHIPETDIPQDIHDAFMTIHSVSEETDVMAGMNVTEKTKDTEVIEETTDIEVNEETSGTEVDEETEKPNLSVDIEDTKDTGAPDISGVTVTSDDEPNNNDSETNDQNNIEETMENLDPSKTNDNTTATIVCVVLCVLSLFVGFVLGRATSDIMWEDVKSYFVKDEKPVKVKVVYKRLPLPADTASVADKEQQDKATKDKKDMKTKQKGIPSDDIPSSPISTKSSEQKSATTKPAETKASLPSYDKDPRVRTGAYAIVGVQRTVTVAKGQTLASISKAYLGPGMECYVEALNGVREVKEGQKIKIPELKLKKKK